MREIDGAVVGEIVPEVMLYCSNAVTSINV